MTRNRMLYGFMTGVMCGCIGTLFTVILLWRNEAVQVKYHWHRVETFLQHINTPHSSDAIKDPYDVMPSLATLVSLGELDYVDLVFPGVAPTKEMTRYLVVYYRENQDIVFMEFNPEYQRYPLSGQQPLHLQVWFRKGGRDKVRQMIETIEKRYAAKE